MANLLDRYGIKPDLSKRFSISFINDFVDCSYRTFLTRFMGVGEYKADLPRTFGSGCHRGLTRINKALQENREPCLECEFNCKLNTTKKVEAMKRTLDECEIKRRMLEEFYCEFDTEFEDLVVKELIKRKSIKTMKEARDKIEMHKRIAITAMSSALFEKQPIGDILMTETMLTGKLKGRGILGVVDLGIGIKGKALITDYKTAASAPTSAFPLRQLAIYIHMLEGMGLPVHGISALYMLKKEAPKKPRKNSKPFEPTVQNFFSLERNRPIYENTIDLIGEDIMSIEDCITNGIFIRNRGSMFCPCDAVDYCENMKLLDKFAADKANNRSPAKCTSK